MVRRIRSGESKKGDAPAAEPRSNPSNPAVRPERRRHRAIASESVPPATLPPEPAYAKVPTFFGLPQSFHPEQDEGVATRSSRPNELEVDVLLSGLPYDGGALYRSGSRFAPRAVREASLGFGSYSDALGIGVWDELTAADGGDAPVGPDDVSHALSTIAGRAEHLARSGVVGGWVGGDQTVTLGVLRGIHRAKLKGVALVHFDSCTDTLGPAGTRAIHQHSAIRAALEEGLIRADSAIQVGGRGPHASESEIQLAIGRGFELVKSDDVKWDLHGAISQIRKIVRQGAVYVSVDISVLDPAHAPGASTLRPGGLTTWELQQLLRALVGARIVGFDVVEVAPPYDPSGVTALAAAAVVHEMLAVIADGKRSARPAPSSIGRRKGRRLSP